MKLRWCLLVPAGLGLLSLLAGAADWPQWRGPRRNGISQESGLLKEWPKDGPRLLWRIADVGDGYATPSVAGTRLYILGNRGMDHEFIQALSVEDGKPLWSTRLGSVGSPNQEPPYPMARSTPTVDGDALYALGPTAIWPACGSRLVNRFGKSICVTISAASPASGPTRNRP